MSNNKYTLAIESTGNGTIVKLLVNGKDSNVSATIPVPIHEFNTLYGEELINDLKRVLIEIYEGLIEAGKE